MGNKWIQNLIEDYIKGTGVSIILSRSIVSDLVDVFYYNWISLDEKYYSLLCPCSQTQILPVDRLDTMGCYSPEKVIEHNLRVFETKSEWDEGKWSSKFAEEYNSALKKVLLEKKQVNTILHGYTIKSVILHVQPCLGMTIWYHKSKLECLTIWFGYKTTIVTSDPEFEGFIQDLGFSGCVEVICNQSSTKRIGAFNDN